MRRTYIVCYDIADPKRLRNVFKKMRAWGDHLQFSVFECQLRNVDLIRLRALGKPYVHIDAPLIVV